VLDRYTVYETTTTPTPDGILAAADRIVLRDSVRRLTLEAVAREAQLSKVGHHR
jgi:AcrR family transcriptional regulator